MLARLHRARSVGTLTLAAMFFGSVAELAQDLTLQARQTISEAARYYVNDVAVRGGDVYYYSPDLQRRLG